MNANISILQDYKGWLRLSVDEQDKVIDEISKRLSDQYSHLFTKEYANGEFYCRVPTFKHIYTGIDFNLVIGGTFKMGLSVREEEQARLIDVNTILPVEMMRPVRTVTVEPFLISRAPILDSFAISHMNLDATVFRPEFGASGDRMPVYLTRSESETLTKQFGFDLPSEAQWEYACRGGTSTLFYFGTILPNLETLENQILLYNFNDPAKCENAVNPFGLIGMFVGEWCEDSFKENYTDLHDDDLPFIQGPPYVVRGGSATWWPWQDCEEWIMCMSAMRRNSDYLDDGTAAIRFVKRLESI